MFERGECSFMNLFSDTTPTFESNIAYTLRFMIDTKVRALCLYTVTTADSLTGRRNELDRSTGRQISHGD